MSDEEKGWRGHRHRPPVLRIVGMVLAGVAFAAAFALAFGWLVMILWNWIMPAIFHLAEISYWQGFGILLLAKIVFGAFGSGGRRGGMRGPWHRKGWHDEWDWRYARDFWKEEGREAFERYVERRKTQAAGSPGATPDADRA